MVLNPIIKVGQAGWACPMCGEKINVTEHKAADHTIRKCNKCGWKNLKLKEETKETQKFTRWLKCGLCGASNKSVKERLEENGKAHLICDSCWDNVDN